MLIHPLLGKPARLPGPSSGTDAGRGGRWHGRGSKQGTGQIAAGVPLRPLCCDSRAMGRPQRNWGALAPLCVLFLLLFLLTLAASYKPVVVVHGLFDSPSDFSHLLRFINQTHPGTNVTVVDLFDHSQSLKPLWVQVAGFRQAISPIMQNAADGVHLICYSQGGLICRALLSTMPDHNVDTFISLSAPQMGQYGDTRYLRWLFPRYMKSNLYRFCYTRLGQDVSICNYWNDPHHRDLYLNSSNFLALLNSERVNPNATAWKRNLLRIRKLVLVGGPDDGVITPWQSSLFAFYNLNETVTDMEQQLVYLQDSFGLKTLAARGAIARCPVPGVPHTAWHSNRTVYEACLAPWLS